MPRNVLLTVGCLLSGNSLALFPVMGGAQTVTDSSLDVDIVASGFSFPTGFAFLDENDLLVIEKNNGQVQRVQNGVITDTVLDLDVTTSRARGLLGIALHPNFESNSFVYIYYSASDIGSDSADSSSWTDNRLSRFTWNGSELNSEMMLKSFPRDPGQNNESDHHDGPIEFGLDGTLYGTTGDLNRNRAERNNPSQSSNSMGAGGLYRLNAPGDDSDGSIPADNPFVANPNSDFHLWYAYGIRNSFGLAVDPVTGALWDTENGPNSMDEINYVSPGFNSGWKRLMGPLALDPEGQDTSDLVDLGTVSTYSDPELSLASPIGITDLVFMAGGSLGATYEDAVLFSGSNSDGRRISILRLNAQRDGFQLTGDLADLVADPGDLDTINFGEGFGLVTEMQIGPDGALYVLSGTKRILYRIAAAAPSADFDNDGDVDGDDFLIWQASFGVDDGGDADHDGDTDGDDFLVWQAQFGNTLVGAAANAAMPRLVTTAAVLARSYSQYMQKKADQSRRLGPLNRQDLHKRP